MKNGKRYWFIKTILASGDFALEVTTFTDSLTDVDRMDSGNFFLKMQDAKKTLNTIRKVFKKNKIAQTKLEQKHGRSKRTPTRRI